MPITKLRIENFKGIREVNEFEIKPITLFIGPNSSGKSSCIHALTALAQSSKLLSSGRPLVLDDENALVHLGRFIEVIHSHSYSDAIRIGFEATGSQKEFAIGVGKFAAKFGPGDTFAADFSFRSTKRTQDVYLDQLSYRLPGANMLFSRAPKSDKYSVNFGDQPMNLTARNESSLNVTIDPSETTNQDAFTAFVANETCRRITSEELAAVHYLGPFRQAPQRRYPTYGASPTEVGAQGESAITLLANEYVQSKGRPRAQEIGTWLTSMGLAKAVDLGRVGRTDQFDVNMTLQDGVSLPIADLGYGMSQVLPVLVQCSFAKRNSTLLFEQPELHLNDSAARLLSLVLAEAAMGKNLHIVAETHSRALFYGLMDQVKSGTLASDDIAIYIVKRQDTCSHFKRIYVEPDGEVSDPWDKGL